MSDAMSSQPRRADSPVWALLRWTLYACGLFGGFFVTLWLTEPPRAPTPADNMDGRTAASRLAARQITSYAELADVGRAAGLRPVPQSQGVRRRGGAGQ